MRKQSTNNKAKGPLSSTDEKLGLGDRDYFQHDYGSRPPENYIWLVSDVIRYGRPGNILDLGCGPGLFVEMAFRWGLEVEGIDGSEDALSIALGRNPNLKITHCLLSGRLPFDDCTIDNILLNQVIEHLSAKVLSNVLHECRRVMRKDGVLFVRSPSKANKREVLKDPTHINPLYPSELRSALLSAGFEVLTEPISCRFYTRNSVFAKILRWLMKTSARDWLSAETNAYARKL